MNRKVFVFTILFFLAFVCLGHSDEYNRWGQTDLNALLKRELPHDWVRLGHSRGGTSTVVTGTPEIPVGYSVVKIIAATSSKTLPNAEAGKILTLVAVERTGTVTITPDTSTGWACATMDANGETLTIQYIDDTVGWVIVGISGTTVTGKNSHD